MTYGLETPERSAQGGNLAEFSEKEKLDAKKNFRDSFSSTPEQSEIAQLRKLFEQYKKEMLYLRNFSEKTLRIYEEVLARWIKYVGRMPTEKNLSQFVIGMREGGLNTTSCNISIRGFNAFLTWLKDNGHCPQTFSNGKPFKLAKLPEEKKQFRVFDDAEIHKILSFKPSCRNEHRIFALVCTLIDTGMRINEALNLEIARVNWDNLLLTITKGKGKKERTVPMSLDLRKILLRYVTNHRTCKFDSPFLFCTSNGTPLSHRNAMRDFQKMLDNVEVSKDSIDHCFHSFRRKFAKSYIKNGGNIAYLQHAMGHATLAMTKHYIGDVEIEDLQMMHHKTSLLGKLR